MANTKEIDIISIILKVVKEWRTLLKFMVTAIIIGIIVALSTPKSYTASVILAPEISSGGLGMSESLGELASSFGVDLNNKSSMDAIYPELYPEIFASNDFVLQLFDVPIRLKSDNTLRTYHDHLLKETKLPFWNYPKVWISKLLKNTEAVNKNTKADVLQMSKENYEICNWIKQLISCRVDKKTSVITINVTDQDPLAAAILADTLQSRLKEYITNYRTHKARNDYKYYERLYVESKADYLKAQQLYASYSDANQDVILASFKSKQEELENEMQLKYNIYTQMTAQLQKAQAKVQERTPVFTIIEKPVMPYKASGTPRAMIVVLFMLVGIIFDGIWICFLRDRKK